MKKVSLLVFLGLMGCTRFAGLSVERYLANKHDFMIGQGEPPAYVDGYVDGCSYGRRLAGEGRFSYRKNELRFEKDALYARGWQEGQINCRNEVLSGGVGLSGKETVNEASYSDRRRRVSAEDQAVEAEMRKVWEELKK